MSSSQACLQAHFLPWGKLLEGLGGPFVLEQCFFVSLARAEAHWCGAGKHPGEEICWEFLISFKCFTSILAGCATKRSIVTACPLAEAPERPRLPDQTSQAGSLSSTSRCLLTSLTLHPLKTALRAKQILLLNSILACYHSGQLIFMY